jgi:chaperonin GroEL (HSP60 family)
MTVLLLFDFWTLSTQLLKLWSTLQKVKTLKVTLKNCNANFVVGDGTTSVVVLAGELLKVAKPFIEEGVHSQTIIKGFRKACELVTIFLFHLN